MLATHYGYLATTKSLVSNCFMTFSLILKAISSRVLLSICFTGNHSSLRGSLCITISIYNPSISWYDQANTSTCSCRILVIFSFSSSFRVASILTSFKSSYVPRLITSTDSWCAWMILDSYFNSLINFSCSSQSSSPSSLAWLIGKFKSHGTIVVSLSMESWVHLHVLRLCIYLERRSESV